jgi:hypothetical protein
MAANLLPDGDVLITGGIGRNQQGDLPRPS